MSADKDSQGYIKEELTFKEECINEGDVKLDKVVSSIPMNSRQEMYLYEGLQPQSSIKKEPPAIKVYEESIRVGDLHSASSIKEDFYMEEKPTVKEEPMDEGDMEVSSTLKTLQSDRKRKSSFDDTESIYSAQGDATGDTPTSKWQYFKLLHSLKDVVKPRASTGILTGVLASDIVETSLPESPQVEYQTGTVEPSLVKKKGVLASSSHTQDTPKRQDKGTEKQGLTLPSTRRKKKGARKSSKTDDYSQSILNIEQQKIQYLKEKSNRKQDKEDDEDLMFFKSLLSHVKRIPAMQKLKFRSHLQELVQQFAYPVPAVSPHPDTHGSSSSASAYSPQMSPYSNAHSPIESQIYATDMTTLPM